MPIRLVRGYNEGCAILTRLSSVPTQNSIQNTTQKARHPSMSDHSSSTPSAESEPTQSAVPTEHPAFSMPESALDAAAAPRVWVCRGIPLTRQILTLVGVVAAAAVFFFLALWQGATMLVSTIIGVIFIGGFVGYLRVIAPTPFTITLDATGITRAERTRHRNDEHAHDAPAHEPMHIPWTQVAKVKEERFKSGKSVSLTVYKRVGERGLHRAFVIYRDDVGEFDGLLGALRAGLPESSPWLVERVHE